MWRLDSPAGVRNVVVYDSREQPPPRSGVPMPFVRAAATECLRSESEDTSRAAGGAGEGDTAEEGRSEGAGDVSNSGRGPECRGTRPPRQKGDRDSGASTGSESLGGSSVKSSHLAKTEALVGHPDSGHPSSSGFSEATFSYFDDLPPWYPPSSPGDTTLVFESRFESGNLRRAIQARGWLGSCKDTCTGRNIVLV